MMRIYLIRHAAAFDRDRKRWPDDGQRPLTPEGIKKFRRAAAGLEHLVGEVDCMLTSPLVRARETAKILETVAGWPHATEVPELAQGRTPEQALAAIGDRAAAHPKLERLALVGHEPNLTELLSVCVAGPRAQARGGYELKKGGAACLLFPAAALAGHARIELAQAPSEPLSRAKLEWLITPKALRALAGR
ncbi:MAG: histidine phosphatase family protein [Steroidobacteraceae bacterium]